MSQWSGFYRRSLDERLQLVADATHLDAADALLLRQEGPLPLAVAEQLIENVIGTFPLPLGLAVNFVVDGEPVVVPMAVEESSVVAAASHAAKLAAAGGGFHTLVHEPITIGQVELRDVADPLGACELARGLAPAWTRWLNESIPAMVARGGGVRSIEPRAVGAGRVVLHIHVDCRDAMGANLVNGLCERLGPRAALELDGRLGLRILSNLADQRLASARCTIPATVLGADLAQAIVEANDFARLDPYRAATHNKGILNGVDPVVVATGNDWRAIEAGAHAFAARDGQYRALTTWELDENGDLAGELVMPMSLGVVGGVTRIHPVARAARRILGEPDARRLAAVAVSVGLAQNLAALRALAGEGIQRGHMELHARNLALAAGLAGDAAQKVARRMVEESNVSASRARELAAEAGSGPQGRVGAGQ